MAQQYAKDQSAGFSNHIRKVAIVGVTGTIGTYITSALVATGKHTITAMTRKDSKATIPAGVTAAPVDYDQPDSVVAALRGQDMLIITLPATAAKGLHNQLAKAAHDAGVRWVITNNFGLGTSKPAAFDVLLGAGKLAEQEYIQSLSTAEQPISWVAVSGGFWYEFSLAGGKDRFGFNVHNGKREVVLMDEGRARMCTSSFGRVGEAVAKLLSLPVLPEDAEDKRATLSKWRNATVEVSSFTVSQKQMWECLQRATGTQASDWVVSHENAKERYASGMQAMKSGDLSGFVRLMYSRMFYGDEEPMLWTNSANAELGLQDEDVDAVTRHAMKLQAEGVFDPLQH